MDAFDNPQDIADLFHVLRRLVSSQQDLHRCIYRRNLAEIEDAFVASRSPAGVALQTLRERISEVLASVKAYDLPDIAFRLGLSAGSQDEAFRSKRMYVLRRIESWEKSALISLAESVVLQHGGTDLEDLLGEIALEGQPRVSQLTRRAVLKTINSLDPLFGEHPSGLYGCLESLCPKWDGIFDASNPFRSLRDEIEQHYIRNPEDWSNATLLESCGALDCSQARFFRLIALLVHPLSRLGKDQFMLVEILNALLRVDGFELVSNANESGHPIFEIFASNRGVRGAVKNLIFASIGPKPEIVLVDAINNDIRITKHADKCLVYDRPISSIGLTWTDLVKWWQETNNVPEISASRSLGERLSASVQQTKSVIEWAVFKTYYRHFPKVLGARLPALIPQVYLHYDPQTIAQRRESPVLVRQRMDFLMLLPGNARIVLEIDGKHHYADGSVAAPRLYATMVQEDRELRLRGYEVYRFGAAEFSDVETVGDRLKIGERSQELLGNFFRDLFGRHRILPSSEALSREGT